MSKWIVTLNNKKNEYNNYKDALAFFLKEISNYFWKHTDANKESTEVSVFDSVCVSDSLRAFFCYLYDERIITDEEILIEARLGMLLSYLCCDDPNQIKENALKSINKSFEYHYKDEKNDYAVDIKVINSKDEIVVDLNADHGDSYLYTNAFIMDDDKKKYFLKSHQVCNSSSKKSDLGVAADLDITLEKI